MTIKEFSQWLIKLEETKSRNEITIIISQLLSKLELAEVKKAIYMLQGQLYPVYKSLEFNFSVKLILKALSKIAPNVNVTEIYRKTGDVGLTAKEVVKLISSKPLNELSLFSFEKQKAVLSLIEVYSRLENIAAVDGKGSQEQKTMQYCELISGVDSQSAKYITRIILGDLRLGLSDKTILDALSWFINGDKSIRPLLDKAFGSKADLGELGFLVKTKAKNIVEELNGIHFEPGIPVLPKLVEREKDAESVFKRIPLGFVQQKLDGLRGQIHKINDEVNIYSRNMENMTNQFPEIVNAVSKLSCNSVIIDSEIIGFNPQTNDYFSYQETMQRKRKHNVDSYSDKFPAVAMCFDVIYLNGQDIAIQPIEKRLKLLKDLLNNNQTLRLLESKQFAKVEEVQSYFDESLKKGLEGIIIKQIGTQYEPGTRNFKWIKLKGNSLKSFVDTIDVAVLGYYAGRGNRAKFGVGAILAGIYDEEVDKYYSIGKIGTGMSEEMLKKIFQDLQPLAVLEKPLNYEVSKSLYPTQWVTPKIIIEVEADEITRSPNHTAALGVKTKVKNDNPGKGLSIRFPRLKIWNRDKKLPNSVKEIVRMYELRKTK